MVDRRAPVRLTGRGVVQRMCVLLAGALGIGGCASIDAPLPAREQVARVVLARPLPDALRCLERYLDAVPDVAGIRPTTVRVSLRDGVRLEQWFITKDTHRRVAFELRAHESDRAEVTVHLLQRHGQYLKGGFEPTALAAVACCAC